MSEYNFEFRKIDNEKASHLSEIIKLCLNIHTTDEYFKWKYVNNPAGEAIGFEAYEKDKVAACYSIIPELYNINGKIIRIYQSVDSMTYPTYRKKGLFVKLATMAHDYAFQKDGYINIFATAGVNSFPGFVKRLNFKKIASIPYLFIYKGLFYFRTFRKELHTDKLQAVEKLDEKFDNYFLNKKNENATIAPLINTEFINWRVINHPYIAYKIIRVIENNAMVGYCVFYLDENQRCKISYLDFLNFEYALNYLSSMLGFIFSVYNVNFVYTWKPSNKKFCEIYHKNGFIINPFNKSLFSYKIPFVVCSKEPRINGVDWFNKHNFDLQPLIQD